MAVIGASVETKFRKLKFKFQFVCVERRFACQFEFHFLNGLIMNLIASLVIALSIVMFVDARIYLSCELAKELSRYDMERHLIPHWICLVQAESQGNTSKIVEMPNRSANFGIFQVKDLLNVSFTVSTLR